RAHANHAGSMLQDQPDRARKEIDQILKAEPRKPLGHILLGQLQIASAQWAAAEATFSTDPTIGSPYPQPHYFLGNIAARQGKIDEAQDHYQKSLDIDNRYLPSRTALAEVFLKKGLLADSREEIRKVLTAQPQVFQAR